ncbi:hypothetical protein ABEB36_001063 [Hypothenemus hampei]|uniref:C2H2-type domain-containing protein n=1 Tax=Hypothenemus hampei TaxID=57062 RepID=A0ABD1FDZ6_HYPHA
MNNKYNNNNSNGNYHRINPTQPIGLDIFTSPARPIDQKTFECSDCKKKYMNSVSLTRHKKYECQNPPKFSCHMCSFKTRYQFTLKAHLIRLHNVVLENSVIQF